MDTWDKVSDSGGKVARPTAAETCHYTAIVDGGSVGGVGFPSGPRQLDEAVDRLHNGKSW